MGINQYFGRFPMDGGKIAIVSLFSWQILLSIYNNRAIGQTSRVLTNWPGDQGSIPGRVIPKTQKMVLDAALLKTQHYKVRIKGKVEQSKECSRY